MALAHRIAPTVPQAAATTVRLGQTSQLFDQDDLGKYVKLTAESRYELCAAGDPIEGVVLSVDSATSGGYKIGSIYSSGRMWAVADGLEATAGTGTIAVGDYVVCGTVTARNTIIPSSDGFARVCKATNQPGATVAVGTAGADTAAAIKTVTDAAIAKLVDAGMNAMFAWRVVSLGSVGTGAVGTKIVVERVNVG